MKTIFQFLFIVILFLLICCARRGSPSGGPKDKKAPVMVTSNPPYKSIHFNKKKIRIYFDEYIVLKNLNKQLIISPPLKYHPIITPQGTPSKYINIKILDTLRPNTTYTFNFGNAVRDNNENNTLEHFKYVFSTGNYIDSLQIKGAVKDAFLHKTDKYINILLYKNDSTYNDSIIYKKKPYYVTNTLDSINFHFTNIQKGKYVLIALKDSVNNYLFNSTEDKIGFYKKSIELPKDSIILTKIRLFKEIDPLKLKRPKQVSKGKIIFPYKGEKGNLQLKLLSKVPKNFKDFSEFEKTKDSLNYWFTPFKTDSLKFQISNNTDFIDTITVKLHKKKTDSLIIYSNIKSILDFNDTIFLKTTNPITKIDFTKITFFDQDTIPINYYLKKKSATKLAFLFDKKPQMKYQLKLFPRAITDLYNNSNDSLKYTFKTKKTEDYGAIILHIKKQKPTPIIIELLSEKYKILKKQFVTNSQKIEFNLIPPNTYHIRAIIDTNNNKKWDTGNFLSKTQPEEVIYFPKKLQLRANWIVNETFKIQ